MFLVVDLIETFTKRFQLILMVPDGEFKHILPFFFFSYCMLKDSACFVPMAKVNADLTERLSNAFKSIEQNRAIDFAQNGQSSRASCHRVKIEKKKCCRCFNIIFLCDRCHTKSLPYLISPLLQLPRRCTNRRPRPGSPPLLIETGLRNDAQRRKGQTCETNAIVRKKEKGKRNF